MSSIAVVPGLDRTHVGVRRPAARAAQRPVQPSAETPVRLTRRGRVVVTMLFLVALLAVVTVYGARSAASGHAGTPVQTRMVSVGQGETLWQIAGRVAAPGKVREMVLQIEELNALPGPALAVGQQIAVPVG